MDGVLTAAGMGVVVGVIEAYLVVVYVRNGLFAGSLLFTSSSVFLLFLTSIISNGILFAAAGLCLLAIIQFIPRMQSEYRRCLGSLFAILALRIFYSGYLTPILIPENLMYYRIIANLAFFVLLGFAFPATWRLMRRLGKIRKIWGVGFVSIVLIGGAAGTFAFPDVPPFYRHQKWKEAGARYSQAPNIILILVDTARADHLSAYGYNRRTTPNLEAIAREGVLFEQFRSHSNWTIPSVATLFTSLHESVVGTHTEFHRLPQNAHTLAEILQENGYTTAFISSNPLVSQRQNFTQGFDYYINLDDLWDAQFYRNHQPSQLIYVWRLALRRFSPLYKKLNWRLQILLNESKSDREYYLDYVKKVADNRLGKADWIFRHTKAYLKQLFSKGYDPRKNKLFLYLHYFDPHYPYRPPGGYRRMFDPDYKGPFQEFPPGIQGKTGGHGIPLPPDRHRNIVAQYDGEIRFFDHWLGNLVRHLKEKDLYDNTLFIVTGDHGEAFYDHEGWDHGHSVFEEQVRVPLVMRLPSKIPAGVRSSALSGLVDLMPTILDVSGINIPAGVQGASLMPVIRGERRPDVFYGEVSGLNALVKAYQYVISKNMKLIVTFDESLASNQRLPFRKGFLFDLKSDQDERHNLFQLGQPLSALYLKLLNDQRVKVLKRKRLTPDKSVEYDENLRNRLRSLGYLGD